MESQAMACQTLGSKDFCKRDKDRIQKTDYWLVKKQLSHFPMCYQFRKAYIDGNQPTLDQLEELFGCGRCLCCGYTLLHLAINVGSKELVEYYLSRKHDIGVRTDNGETTLHLACATNDSWFVEQLLIAKADVNDIDDLGCTPLQICLSHDVPSTAILKVLFEHGARPNQLFSPDDDVEESIAKMIKANTRNSSGVLPLYEAVYKGDYAAAQQLLKNGACPNSLNCYRRSLLQVACYNKSVECAEALVDAGASVNDSDLEGRTALHYAIISESTEIVELLLARNCDLWVRDSDGYTALGMAALTNRLQVTNQLLYHGARCTEVLLMEALERQCSQVALSILRICNFRVHDTQFGRSLLYCAIASGQQEIVSYLQSLGVEVGYEGSDDEEENLAEVPRYASLVTKTAVSARFVSSSLVAYRAMESLTEKEGNRRHLSLVPETKLPASFVSSKVVARRSTKYSIRKMVKNKATKTTKKKKQQSRYARIADDCQRSKLCTCQQNGIAREKTCDALEQKNRRGYEKKSSRKCIVSDDRPAILFDKAESFKHINTAIRSKSKLFLKTASTKSSNLPMTEKFDSFFQLNCQKRKNSKLTTYEGLCFKSFSKDAKGNSASSNVETFFKFYKYCVQYK